MTSVSNPVLTKAYPATPAGFFLVDKPAGKSSAAVTNRLKWLLKPMFGKGVKIGHGGTLDPFATGVLPIGLGKGTKQLQALLEGDKTYRFTVTWGSQTTTDDIEGEVVTTSDVRPDERAILAVLPRFTGEIMQVPPAFSALKINGRRAYDMARAGETVELTARQVVIRRLALLENTLEHGVFEAEVSKGTYIRVLGRELALACGTVGHVSVLTRTQHGPFTLAQCVDAETLDRALEMGDWQQYLLPLAACPVEDSAKQA